MKQRIEQLDWYQVTSQMHDNGYSVLNTILTPDDCDNLIAQYDDKRLYRKTIIMERYRLEWASINILTTLCRQSSTK